MSKLKARVQVNPPATQAVTLSAEEQALQDDYNRNTAYLKVISDLQEEFGVRTQISDNAYSGLLMAKLVEDSAAPITMTRGEAEAAGIPADRIQDKAAADAAAAAANVSAVEDAAANKTDTASKTDTAKTEHKG